MTNKNEYIFVTNGAATINTCLNDLHQNGRVTVLNGYFKDTRNFVLKQLRRIHVNKRINLHINLPFKDIWKCSLRSIKWNKSTKYFVIIIGSAMCATDWKYIDGLRKKYDVKLILFLMDPWERNISSADARNFNTKYGYDLILTFDPKEAKKYGFIYTNLLYSVISPEKSNDIEYDLYSAAGIRFLDRLDSFYALYKYFEKNGILMHYRLIGVPKEQRIYEKIIYNKQIPYQQVIEGVKKSNCILEVLSDDQDGATLRYYEAVCYNKKLVTNNKNVVNLPFYNPEYIHVFEKPEDIDCDWVKERIPIDYGYDGRFSPLRLIDRIIELDEKKEG